MKDFFQSKTVKIGIISAAAVVVIIFVFGLGIFVGLKKAEYSFSWAQSYQTNFGGRPSPNIFNQMDQAQENVPDPNGGAGIVISKDANSITVHCQDDNTEKKFLVNSQTIIVCHRNTIVLSDIKDNDNVVIIGEPDSSGNIIAKFIRACMSPFNP